MTETQRNYLADLAGQKGVRLKDTDNWSVAKASEEIDRLKEMPDTTFDDITEAEVREVDNLVDNALTELSKWGFVEGRQ
ncbi:MAG: hypothetical protein U0L97_00340 [Candidatus Saccharimonadaceae bacterium]|nr:hypothetical protein [Candidatus Saccharimonadaceae bacterium]